MLVRRKGCKMLDRLERARRQMAKMGLEAMLFSSRENKFYIAGLYSGSGCILLTGAQVYAIVDGRYFLAQKRRMAKGITLLADSEHPSSGHVNRILEEEGIRRLGFEAEEVSFAVWQKWEESLSAKLVPVSLPHLRSVKSEEELSCIRRACGIADRGYAYILERVREGMTEKQVENELLFYMKSLGAQRESFDIIVASGENGAMPHAKAGDRVLRRGDFVTMDFGARVGEYCSDITRSFALGAAKEPLRTVYGIVLEAQERAIAAVRPGRWCCEIDAAAREWIAGAGYGEYFSHNLGHSMGIACHEEPRFGPKDETVLEPGMVLTVEPGIYLEGAGGIRIEDDILVTEDGCEVLTKAPKELRVVEGLG